MFLAYPKKKNTIEYAVYSTQVQLVTESEASPAPCETAGSFSPRVMARGHRVVVPDLLDECFPRGVGGWVTLVYAAADFTDIKSYMCVTPSFDQLWPSSFNGNKRDKERRVWYHPLLIFDRWGHMTVACHH